MGSSSIILRDVEVYLDTVQWAWNDSESRNSLEKSESMFLTELGRV